MSHERVLSTSAVYDDESEDLYQKIFHASPEAIAVTGLEDGRFVEVNESFLRQTGYSPEELIGYTVNEVGLWAEPGKRDGLVTLLQKRGKIETVEIDFKNAGGEMRPYSLMMEIVMWNGKPHIVSHALDISLNKRLEVEREQTLTNEFRQTLRHIDNLIFKMSKNPEGEFIYTLSEGKLARQMGLSTDAVYGKAMEDIFSEEDMRRLIPCVEKVKAGESVVCEETLGDLYLINSYSPIVSGGEVTGIVGTVTDITQQKRLEQMLQKSELQSIVGQLAAGVAHEIRNPLTSIKGFLGLIKKNLERGNDRKSLQYITVLDTELERINSLVSEMLWLNKSNHTSYIPTQLAGVLEEVLPLIEVEGNSQSVLISHNFDMNLPKVLADEKLLKQIFLNICKNGIEAMQEGGELHISTERSVKEIKVIIQDTGPGIPQELLAKIFNPFFTTKEKGTGLGLFICKNIIADMGGEIRISTSPEGTAFTIVLPAIE